MALIKQSDKATRFVLPVNIIADDGTVIRKNRYYIDKPTLFRAYYQLKYIKGRVVPLYPVIYEDHDYNWSCT